MILQQVDEGIEVLGGAAFPDDDLHAGFEFV